MFDSLRTRLTLWYVAFLAVVIVIFGVAAYRLVIHELESDLNRRLEEMSRIFISDTTAEAAEEGLEDPNGVVSTTISELQLRDYQFAVWSESSTFSAATKEIDGQNLQPTGKKFSRIRIDNEDFRTFETSFAVGKNRYRIMVLHSLHEQLELETRLLGLFLVSAAIALILAGLGGYFLVRRSIAPVVEMSGQAGQISAENLGQRLTIKNERDEVGQLGLVVNDLLSRLDASFDQQRRFMADASHELRTPLAIVRGESEIALSKDDRQTADYKESLSIVHEESKRLTKIVEDLFTLARADAGQFAARFAPIYLDEIMSDAVRSIRVLADRKNIGLSFNAESEMPFSGDESLIHRMFLNLLDNAVKYTLPGGKVSVDCRENDDQYEITITDTGIGISDEERPNIFERFYRIDKARSRSDDMSSSGAGLGLSIAQWISKIHSGNILIVSSDDAGSTFRIQLPR